MNSAIQKIIFNRKSKILTSTSNNPSPSNIQMVGAILANVGTFGYMLDNTVIDILKTNSFSELENFNTNIIKLIKESIGYTHVEPMYPNFPNQVANMSSAELYINAIIHYFGDVIGSRILPKYEKIERFPLFEPTKFKWIGLATEETIVETFKEVIESVSSPSDSDKLDIKTFIESGIVYDNPVISNKEKLAFILVVMDNTPNINSNFALSVMSQVKTATDVLRLAAAMSNGDVSLANKTKFISFNRTKRRMILSLLESVKFSLAEDMMRHRSVWIRLGEKLHPGEFSKQYPQAYEAFRKMRNEGEKTFNSKIEVAIRDKEWSECINLLSTRPGDFARRINKLITDGDFETTAKAFSNVAVQVSSTVLWQLFGYFKGRNVSLNYSKRVFIPKKNIGAIVAPNNLKEIDENNRKQLLSIIRSALLKKQEGMEFTDKLVYIDPIANNLLIPSGNRTASKALRQVGRGSRFSINNSTNTVRLFVYWQNQKTKSSYEDRVDLDLSAVMFDENFKSLGHCSWTQLRHGRGDSADMVHSGDITSAPEGASEFLDINLNKLESNVAYIAVNVHSYTGQKYNELDVAFAGWMTRENPGSGEIYEPKTVEGRVDLTSDSVSTTPMILDIKNKEIIWTDLTNVAQGYCSMVENTMEKTTANMLMAVRKKESSATLYELFEVVVQAKGGMITSNKDLANIIIDETSDISPFDLNKIMSEFF